MTPSHMPNQLALSGGMVDLARCQVRRKDEVLSLTQREVALLRYFASNSGRAITRKELLGEVWGYVEGVRTRATDNAIVRLRNKVEAAPEHPQHILSVRGIGYRFEWANRERPEKRYQDREAEPSHFFGRAESLARLGALLSTSRLVTITGAPGMGKTRLARQFALDWSGVTWFADLSTSESLAGITHAVASCLNLHLDPQGDAVEQIGRSLRGQSGALLVLDNFEQVVDQAADTLGIWIRLAPECRFLATSRERLLLDGEHCVALGPLDRSDARALFADRARAVSPAFDGASPDGLDELVDRLDGVPLALELAASQVHMRSLSALSEQLRDLGTRRRDMSPRHRTLRAAFQWSWDLLQESERQAMYQCAVFESPFSLAAAERVLSVSGPVVDVLAGLREKSMIERVDDLFEPRFRMLTTVREFVQSDGAQMAAVHRRHLEWCVARAEVLVEGLKGPEAIACIQSLTHDLPDHMAALERASDPELSVKLLLLLDGSPGLSGFPHLHLRQLERVLKGIHDDAIRCRLLVIQATLLIGRRRFADAIGVLDEADRLAGPESRTRPLVLHQRGRIAEFQGHFEAAEQRYEQAADLSRDTFPVVLATVLSELARLRIDPTQPQVAEHLCMDALELARECANCALEARLLGYLGVLAKGRRKFKVAKVYFQQSIHLARAIGDPVTTVVQTIHMGSLHSYLDEAEALPETMEGDLRDALDIATHLGRLSLQAAATGVLVQLLVESNRPAETGELIDQLPPDWTEVAPMVRAMCWSNIGAARHLRGETVMADRAYARATESFVAAGHSIYTWRTQLFHALFLAEENRWEEAEAMFKRAHIGADPPVIGSWVQDAWTAADLCLRLRQAKASQASARELSDALARVAEAESLQTLAIPIRSSHNWVLRCLNRSLPSWYQGAFQTDVDVEPE